MNWWSADLFDGRYFGVLPTSAIIGTAEPLCTGEELYGFALKAPRCETGDRRLTIRYAATLGDNHSRNPRKFRFHRVVARLEPTACEHENRFSYGHSVQIRKTYPAGRRAARRLAG
jgi:hypothetical protein